MRQCKKGICLATGRNHHTISVTHIHKAVGEPAALLLLLRQVLNLHWVTPQVLLVLLEPVSTRLNLTGKWGGGGDHMYQYIFKVVKKLTNCKN
jgi:hypothetical protein